MTPNIEQLEDRVAPFAGSLPGVLPGQFAGQMVLPNNQALVLANGNGVNHGPLASPVVDVVDLSTGNVLSTTTLPCSNPVAAGLGIAPSGLPGVWYQTVLDTVAGQHVYWMDTANFGTGISMAMRSHSDPTPQVAAPLVTPAVVAPSTPVTVTAPAVPQVVPPTIPAKGATTSPMDLSAGLALSELKK